MTTTQVAPVASTVRTAEATDYALRVVDIRKKFGDREVLKGMSVDVPRGQILVVLGGSGMGKSVLMKHMIGLLKPDSGQVLVDG